MKRNKINFIVALIIFISFLGYTYVAFRPYLSKHITGEYDMAVAFMKGSNPYAKIAHPYAIVNFLIYLPFIKLLPFPNTIKFVQGFFAIAIAILLYFYHKDKKQALLCILLYVSTFHFYAAFARFAINEPETIFFIALGLIFIKNKKHIKGLALIYLSFLIKYYTAVCLPFILLSRKRVFTSAKLILINILFILISIMAIFAYPQLIASIKAHSDQIVRPDNIFILSSGIFGKNLPSWIPLGVLISKISLACLYLIFLFKAYKKKVMNPFLLYLVPTALWLIFPPNNFLWGNYYFWISIVLLFVQSRWATNLYILYLIPEYFLKIANASPLNLRPFLYAGTYFSGVILSILVLKYAFKKGQEKAYINKYDFLKFGILQILFITVLSLIRHKFL